MHVWQMEKPHRQFQQNLNSFPQQWQSLIRFLRLFLSDFFTDPVIVLLNDPPYDC